VIFIPSYLDGADGIVNLTYYEVLIGLDFTVFPSYYEPWGYTPLECLASGLPSITSNLAGFGDYVTRNIRDNEKLGMYIIDRKSKEFSQSADELANIMLRFVQMNRRERIALRYRSEEASLHFDWSNLGRFYDVAYNMVVER
jgi:glycogen(starch) synthase